MRLPLLSLIATSPLILALPSARADVASAAPNSVHAAAATSAPANNADHAKTEDKDSTELGDRMDEMGDAFKLLRKQISMPAKNKSSLELIATIRKGAESAIALTPAKAADLPADERPKFISEYKKQMKHLVAQFDDLAASLKADDNAKAEKQLKELASFQRESHKKFRRPKD